MSEPITAYYCEACRLAVIVIPGHAPIRACTCKASIIASCAGVVTSHGMTKIIPPAQVSG